MKLAKTEFLRLNIVVKIYSGQKQFPTNAIFLERKTGNLIKIVWLVRLLSSLGDFFLSLFLLMLSLEITSL